MNKRKLCDHIIAKMEWWRNTQMAEHLDERTKNEVITILENVVDSVANFRQTYKEE